MQVFVNSLATNHSQVINVKHSDSVKSLKHKIQQLQNINIDDQTLSYCSKPLRDSVTLESYGIKEGATIDLNARLRGGGLQKIKPTTSNVIDESNNVAEKPVKMKKTKSVDLKSLIQRMREQENTLADGSMSIEDLKKGFEQQQDKQLEETKERFIGLMNNGRNLSAVAVISQHNMFAYGTEDGTAKLHHLDPYPSLIQEFPGLHKGKITSMAFTEDAAHLITGGEDMFLKIINLYSRQVVKGVVNYFHRPVAMVSSTHDNESFVFGTSQGAMFCQISSGRFFESLDDGSSIISVSLPFDNKVGVSLEKGNNNAAAPNAHSFMTNELVSSVASAPNNSYIAAGDKEGVLEIYNTNGVDLIYSFGKIHTREVHSIVISKNSKYIVTGSLDGFIKIFDYENKHQIQMFAQAYQDGILCLTISDDNEYIIAGSIDRTFKIYRFKEKRDTKEIMNYDEYTTSLKTLQSTPDGNHLFIHNSNGDVEIIDYKTKASIFKEEATFFNKTHFCVTTDNRYLVYAKDSYSIAVHDLQEKKEVSLIEVHSNSISHVILSHDNKWIISAGYDK